MMCATFHGNSWTTVISSYSLVNANEETDIPTFYNELFSFVWYISKHNNLIIGGDMNAQIGKDENNKFC